MRSGDPATPTTPEKAGADNPAPPRGWQVRDYRTTRAAARPRSTAHRSQRRFTALRLRDEELSLRDIAARLVISKRRTCNEFG
ncbi:hypothetical protein GCM10010244_84890 [Streptomyces coeruleorubidus]|nr:hypothetical protein GCM10010244_84890 [Streptomyces bellus]